MLNKMIKYQFKKIMESKMGNWLIKKPWKLLVFCIIYSKYYVGKGYKYHKIFWNNYLNLSMRIK
jgi:hypothetical protein